MVDYFEQVFNFLFIVVSICVALFIIVFLLMAIDYCIDAFIEFVEDRKLRKAESKQKYNQFKK